MTALTEKKESQQDPLCFEFRTPIRSRGRCIRRPRGVCRRNYNLGISSCRPPLVIAVGAAVHPHYVFVDEFAYGVSGYGSRSGSDQDSEYATYGGADPGAE